MNFLLSLVRWLLDPSDRSWPEGSLREQLDAFRDKPMLKAEETDF